MRALLWYRGKDLRVRDHRALVDACARAQELVPVFVLSPRYFGRSQARTAPHRMQYLLESLAELNGALQERGSRLILLAGPAEQAIPRLADALGVSEVIAQAGYEPVARERDARVQQRLPVPLTLHEGETLASPGSVRTGEGTMFQVFTPFARAFRAQTKLEPALPAPERLPALPSLPRDLREQPLPTLAQLGLRENQLLIAGGEHAARKRLDTFLRGDAPRYPELRDRLDLPGGSGISADLRFGALSIREVWQAATKRLRERAPAALTRYHDELLWREFAYHILHQRPELLCEPYRPEFAGFPWQGEPGHEIPTRDGSADASSAIAWSAWVDGRTGYPVVDAAARQLLATGYVHNRARMISASFLCKHLLIHYARGEAHYFKWLVDGDVASNNMGWQWSAGCGCDAQPYFRVFNPITQGERFDPNGEYVRRHLPELRDLPTKFIHAPWTASDAVLRKAGVELGKTYPHPIVDHADARTRFLLVAQTYLAERKRVD